MPSKDEKQGGGAAAAAAAEEEASALELGMREMMSYVIPGGGGMRQKRCIVAVKCGEHSLMEEATQPDAVGGSNPRWEQRHGNVMHVRRHKKDDGIAVAAIYQVGKKLSRTWVGGNHFDFTEAVKTPLKEFEQEVPMFVSGNPSGGAGSGVLSLRYKWVPFQPEGEDGALSPRSPRSGAALNSPSSMALEDAAVAALDPEMQGELVVTVLAAKGLVMPHRIVRDLTTYVDTGPLKTSVVLMGIYLVVGLTFYALYMSRKEFERSEFERFPKLLNRLQGGHGDWDWVNSLVFMVTSFTTVGFGNHPSLIATLPPCEVPNLQLLADDPFSTLLPADMRGAPLAKISGFTLAGDVPEEQSFPPLPASCFVAPESRQDDWSSKCMVFADDTEIFDMANLLLWKRGSTEPPRNFTADAQSAAALQTLRLPGELGIFGCVCAATWKGELNECSESTRISAAAATIGSAASAGNSSSGTSGLEAREQCFGNIAGTCEEQLQLWRSIEYQKNTCKIFTALYIMFGIGILGGLVGAVGEALLEWVHHLLGGVELAVDTVNDAAAPLTQGVTDMVGGAVGNLQNLHGLDPHEIDDIAKKSKTVTIAFLGLGVVILGGTAVYSNTESLKFIDSFYFTVVTATTVGFGDYYPASFSGKVFTLFYVPFSVVAVAGAINKVSTVPLQSRREGLENYVLAQFGDDPSQGDFDDIRRSAGLRGEASIRSNDFLIAMALRLGYMQADECAKIKRIFAVLDRKGDGELSVEDIDALISAAATRNVKASGESEAAPGLPGARLDSDQSFDEFANPAMGEGEQADDAIVEST
jgi:hypothetical protein